MKRILLLVGSVLLVSNGVNAQSSVEAPRVLGETAKFSCPNTMQLPAPAPQAADGWNATKPLFLLHNILMSSKRPPGSTSRNDIVEIACSYGDGSYPASKSWSDEAQGLYNREVFRLTQYVLTAGCTSRVGIPDPITCKPAVREPVMDSHRADAPTVHPSP